MTNPVFEYLVNLNVDRMVKNAIKDSIIKTNSSLILDLPKQDPQIDLYIRSIYRNLVDNYLDFFSVIIKDPEKINSCVEIDRSTIQEIYRILGSGTGVILAGVHTFGYDHCILAMNEFLPRIQILGNPNPTKGRKLMHQLRKLNRINVTPLSFSSLRHAIVRLKSGGIVAIAIDLPIKNREQFVFFNRLTCLTDAHTRLAVQTGARIFLFYSHRIENGKYRGEFQEVLPPKNCENKKDLVSAWAQKSYQQVEYFIREWPDAWHGITFDLFDHN